MENYITRKKSSKKATEAMLREKEVFSLFTEYLKRSELFKPEDLKGLNKYWEVKTIAKNNYFFKEEDVPEDFGFLMSGAMKLFRRHDKGYQVFALLSGTDHYILKKKFEQKSPALFNALCVEDSILITIGHQRLSALLEERPAFAEFFTEQSENMTYFLEERLISFQLLTAQERYEGLKNNFPELLNRFSLHDIASYLGMTPETLSRIRALTYKRAS